MLQNSSYRQQGTGNRQQRFATNIYQTGIISKREANYNQTLKKAKNIPLTAWLMRDYSSILCSRLDFYFLEISTCFFCLG